MTLLAATVLFTHYLLAAGRPVVLIVLAARGRRSRSVLLLSAHGALVATARADLIGQAVVAVATGALVLHTARPRRPVSSVG